MPAPTIPKPISVLMGGNAIPRAGAPRGPLLHPLPRDLLPSLEQCEPGRLAVRSALELDLDILDLQEELRLRLGEELGLRLAGRLPHEPVPLAGQRQLKTRRQLVDAHIGIIEIGVHLDRLSLGRERLVRLRPDLVRPEALQEVHAGDLPLRVALEVDAAVRLRIEEVVAGGRLDLVLLSAAP